MADSLGARTLAPPSVRKITAQLRQQNARLAQCTTDVRDLVGRHDARERRAREMLRWYENATEELLQAAEAHPTYALKGSHGVMEEALAVLRATLAVHPEAERTLWALCRGKPHLAFLLPTPINRRP